MIVVTGEPRSGTSLMMRIVDSLGMEIAGDQLPGGDKRDKKSKERSDYLNPEGFWEIGGVVSRGIHSEEQALEYKDKAIKLVTNGLSHTIKPVIDKIDKVIFCLRNPREVAQSQKKLSSTIMVASTNEDDWTFSPEHMKADLMRYVTTVGTYLLRSVNKTDLWDRTLVVDYGDLLKDAEPQIKRISEFLEVPYNPETQNLIRQDLYRSSPVPETNDLADDIYNAIKAQKFDDMLDPIMDCFRQKQLENVRWLDDTEYFTWTISGWDLHKSLKINNKGIRDKLVQSAKTRPLPTICKHYSATGEDYTVERVDQLGSLVRSKIICNKKEEEVTREQCFNCWQHMKR